MASGVTLDTLQEKQKPDDFVEAKRSGICGVIDNRFASNNNKTLWYIGANNLYGNAMMQKLPYKDSNYSDTSLDTILNTPDDSDHG